MNYCEKCLMSIKHLVLDQISINSIFELFIRFFSIRNILKILKNSKIIKTEQDCSKPCKNC